MQISACGKRTFGLVIGRFVNPVETESVAILMNDLSTCPKCGFPLVRPVPAECGRCGVIISKYRQRQAQPREPAATPEAEETNAGGSLRELFFAIPGRQTPILLWSRAALLAALAGWGGRLVFAGLASNAAGESLLHQINLPFHEAGHVLFRPFGAFVTSLGGTLGQLLIPLICLLVLLFRSRDPFGAAVCLWWLGENFLDIAPYINDSRAGELPLLGGNFGNSSPYGFHDWEFILSETGLLRYDHLLAAASHHFGALLMVAATVWGGLILYRQFRPCQEHPRTNGTHEA